MLKVGRTEVNAMAAVLDADYDSVEDAALAALEAAEGVFASRAKFVVVGQLKSTKERRSIPPNDPEAIKLSLGWYSTEGDARSAAESLWTSTASGDQFWVWVLPVHHGTPGDLHAKRKVAHQEAAAKAREAVKARIHASIEKRHAEAAVRAAGGKGACECSHPAYEHRFDGTSRGGCALPQCPCPKFKERSK